MNRWTFGLGDTSMSWLRREVSMWESKTNILLRVDSSCTAMTSGFFLPMSSSLCSLSNPRLSRIRRHCAQRVEPRDELKAEMYRDDVEQSNGKNVSFLPRSRSDFRGNRKERTGIDACAFCLTGCLFTLSYVIRSQCEFVLRERNQRPLGQGQLNQFSPPSPGRSCSFAQRRKKTIR